MGTKSKREKEEQYFAEQELKKRKQLREKLDNERVALKKDQLKTDHWMKCPKCGHDLIEKCYEDVLIDMCTGCQGVWLDEGEMELLLEGRNAKGFISRFMNTMLDSKG